MPTILDEILADKRKELSVTKASVKIDDLVKCEYFGRETLSFKDSLASSASGIISEFKRKSPSKGWIFPDADPVAVTKGYSDNGASAISILTNDKYFGGCPDFLLKARPNVKCPILRKEFIVDEFQVYFSGPRLSGPTPYCSLPPASPQRRQTRWQPRHTN